MHVKCCLISHPSIEIPRLVSYDNCAGLYSIIIPRSVCHCNVVTVVALICFAKHELFGLSIYFFIIANLTGSICTQCLLSRLYWVSWFAHALAFCCVSSHRTLSTWKGPMVSAHVRELCLSNVWFIQSYDLFMRLPLSSLWSLWDKKCAWVYSWFEFDVLRIGLQLADWYVTSKSSGLKWKIQFCHPSAYTFNGTSLCLWLLFLNDFWEFGYINDCTCTSIVTLLC